MKQMNGVYLIKMENDMLYDTGIIGVDCFSCS